MYIVYNYVQHQNDKDIYNNVLAVVVDNVLPLVLLRLKNALTEL